MLEAIQIALGSVRARNILLRAATGTSSEQPFPADVPYTNKSYHRQLIEVAVVGVILGIVFLMFIQGVINGPSTTTFVEDYCVSTLGRYVPNEIAIGARFDVAQNGLLSKCTASSESVKSLSLGWSGSYDCSGINVRYKTEENPNWLALITETEIPESVMLGETTINLAGLPRFSYNAAVYSPSSRQSFDDDASVFKSGDCSQFE